jgi:hypothetical protein
MTASRYHAGIGSLAGLLDLSEEGAIYLRSALEDHYYARSFLRRVGEEERRIFSDEGWAYGEPAVFGGSDEELFDAQLDTVLACLFLALRGYVTLCALEELADPRGSLHDCLARPDGAPLPVGELGESFPDAEWLMVLTLHGRAGDLREAPDHLEAADPGLPVLVHPPRCPQAQSAFETPSKAHHMLWRSARRSPSSVPDSDKPGA